MLVFTSRRLEPATTELWKPPPPGDKGRHRQSCGSLRLPEKKPSKRKVFTTPLRPTTASSLHEQETMVTTVEAWPELEQGGHRVNRTENKGEWLREIYDRFRRRHGRSRAGRIPDPKTDLLSLSSFSSKFWPLLSLIGFFLRIFHVFVS